MKEVKTAIDEFIRNLRVANPEAFNPIYMSQSGERYSTTGIVPVVNAVMLLPESATRPRIQKAFVEHAAHGLRFGVEGAVKQGWNVDRILNLVLETHQFEITEAEIQLILDSPEEIIKAKTDYQDRNRQERYLEGIIMIYAMTNGAEYGYLLNPRAYIIALMLINDAINEISNPISNIANDYTPLRQFYSTRVVDRTQDAQFSKHNLIQLTDGIDFGDPAPPRLYDSANNITVLLCGNQDFVFEYLRQLERDNTFELSFKPSSQYFMEGNFRLSRIQEHLETGAYFNSINLDGTLITKLYDDSYQTLWINVYDNSITFEEFHNDFQLYGDHIVTQVLHCEYFKEGNNYFVKHLDHEFIFYSFDEYEKRQHDAWQKGNARKRIKTFKIDNGKISLNSNKNILFDFLQMKFVQKDLIEEYFEKVKRS